MGALSTTGALCLSYCSTRVNWSLTFVLMFGREPRSNDLLPHFAFDTNSYQGYLQAKLAELQDFVEANTVQAGAAQKTAFDSHAKLRLFKEGDTVWLSVLKSSN